MQVSGANLSVVRGSATRIPQLPVAHLSRPRLFDAMPASPPRLSLLCAPAGYGKTVQLGEWLLRKPRSGKAVWIALAGRAISLESLAERLSEELEPGQRRSAEQWLAHLAASTEPLRLVLDDLPDELPAALNDWIERLLALPSSRVHLLVSCRRRPAWNLPRLMLRNELLELGARELAFTAGELEALAGLLAPAADRTTLDDIGEQTLGWPAGARMLLSGSDDSAVWMREYLHHELLARLDGHERDVLLGLAHLPKFSAALCAELWEEQGGAALFERLRQAHAFFIPADCKGVWFRLLPAVAHALQGDIAAAELNRLRLRACGVLSSAGYLNEAIEQALLAMQPEMAASYMERLQPTWLFAERHLNSLLGWRTRLPAQLLESTPRLLGLCARALLFSGRLEEGEDCLQRLAQFLPAPSAERNTRLLANWQATYGTLQGLRGNAELARLHCREALAQLSARDWMAMLLCNSTLARVEMASGNLAEAEAILLDAVEVTRRQGFPDGEVLMSVERLRVMIMRKQYGLADALLQGELARLGERGLRPDPMLGRLLFLQGELHLLQGRLDEAWLAAKAGLEEVRGCSAPFVLHGYLLLSEIAACRGKFDDAWLHVHDGERRMHCGNIDDACYRSAVLQQSMRLLARQGQWGEVLTMARELEQRFQGEAPRLPPLTTPSLPQRNQLLLALAEYESGEREQARERLAALLECCERLQLNIVADEARQALADMEHDEDEETDAPGACTTASPVSARALCRGYHLDDLTPREVSVLKLLAEGLSNQEIGKTLFISVNTVKYHAKNINAKLGASRRTQAIHWAKTKGLLG